MKGPISLKTLHRLFAGLLLAVVGLFAGFMAWIWLSYGGLLTGSVDTGTEPELLAGFGAGKFEAAVGRMDLRRNQPDIDPDLPNPFGVPIGQ